MGSSFTALCKKCGHKFTANVGGGFLFHLLHCDRCGRAKGIERKEIEKAYLQLRNDPKVSHRTVSQKHDDLVHIMYPGNPISSKEHYRIAEELAGRCTCGGKYLVDAPPRCPKCKSDEFEDSGEYRLMYD